MEKDFVGYGMNYSRLTHGQCLAMLVNWNISFEDLSDDDLDSLYRVSFGRWAFHLTRRGYIESLNRFRIENAVY